MTWLLTLLSRRRLARELDLALALRRRGRAQRQRAAKMGWETRRAAYPQLLHNPPNDIRTGPSSPDFVGGA